VGSYLDSVVPQSNQRRYRAGIVFASNVCSKGSPRVIFSNVRNKIDKGKICQSRYEPNAVKYAPVNRLYYEML
jgi:hypothetical protein